MSIDLYKELIKTKLDLLIQVVENNPHNSMNEVCNLCNEISKYLDLLGKKNLSYDNVDLLPYLKQQIDKTDQLILESASKSKENENLQYLVEILKNQTLIMKFIIAGKDQEASQ